jgi:histidine ammonia-lyase
MKISGSELNIENVWRVAHEGERVELQDDARPRIRESRHMIDEIIKGDETVYGINTGFGALSSVSISKDQLLQLQRNIVRSHAVGVGDTFSIPETRAILLLRANALARGHSGVRVEVIEKLLEFINKDVIPVVPGQGSVGASGDLAPLAHIALSLIGEGEVFYGGKRMPTADALKAAGGIKPLELQAKEGLSLINGCQVMTGVGLLNAFEARRLNWLTDIAGCMSLESMCGSRKAFDPLIAATRPHPGEAKTARNLLKILGNESGISKSHDSCHRVQDAYSLRCMPQVHGAVKDSLRYSINVLEVEANSSTDNPLVFAKEGKILSCGNFHGEPVAFVLDFLGMSIAAMASISECRIEKLINPAMSGLPAFLAKQGGLNSGMMIVQVAAASLVSENKILSHPASVDSIPTSADKEDHVSMGTIAARKLGQIVRNAENVCAMELFCAAQALDFSKPLKPSAGVARAYDCIRSQVSFAEVDRAFYTDIDKIRKLIRSNELLKSVVSATGELEW